MSKRHRPLVLFSMGVEGHSSNRTQLLVDSTKCSYLETCLALPYLASWKQDAYRRIGGGNSVSRLLPLANDTLHG